MAAVTQVRILVSATHFENISRSLVYINKGLIIFTYNPILSSGQDTRLSPGRPGFDSRYGNAAVVAEWLRRLTRNQIPFGSVGSNPTNCEFICYSFVLTINTFTFIVMHTFLDVFHWIETWRYIVFFNIVYTKIF